MREGIVAPALLVENNQFVKEHQKCRKRAFNDFDCSTCLMALYTLALFIYLHLTKNLLKSARATSQIERGHSFVKRILEEKMLLQDRL